MGILTSILTLPVSAPLKTAWWVTEKLAEQAMTEMNDPKEIKRALIKLEQKLDAGEIDEDTFEALELELLERLRAAQAAPRKAG